MRGGAHWRLVLQCAMLRGSQKGGKPPAAVHMLQRAGRAHEWRGRSGERWAVAVAVR